MNSQLPESDAPHTWGIAFRPTFLFVVAYALNVTPHEIVHALTSYSLGFNSTVFQMWVNPDSTQASPNQLAIIAVSGLLFSLIVGVVCWLLVESCALFAASILYFQRSCGLFWLGPGVGGMLAKNPSTPAPSVSLEPSCRFTVGPRRAETQCAGMAASERRPCGRAKEWNSTLRCWPRPHGASSSRLMLSRPLP